MIANRNSKFCISDYKCDPLLLQEEYSDCTLYFSLCFGVFK